MSDFNVQIKVRSGRIVRAMRVKGFNTIADLCRSMGYSNPTTVGNLVNLKDSPIKESGEWRSVALDLAAAVGMAEEELWPEYMLRVQIRRNVADFDVGHEQLGTMLAAPQTIDRRALSCLLQNCTPRQQKIVSMRFGLDGDAESTLDEIAESLGVTKERVRQLESRAIRKMRQKARQLDIHRIDDILAVT